MLVGFALAETIDKADCHKIEESQSARFLSESKRLNFHVNEIPIYDRGDRGCFACLPGSIQARVPSCTESETQHCFSEQTLKMGGLYSGGYPRGVLRNCLLLQVAI